MTDGLSHAGPSRRCSPAEYVIDVDEPLAAVHSVLVVDDDPHCRGALGRHLQAAGFEVHQAADGDEALRLFYARRIDALLTDVLMPKMSGITLALTCRRLSRSLPIIAFTGASHLPPARCQALAEAGVELLDKPFSGDDLLGALGRASERRGR